MPFLFPRYVTLALSGFLLWNPLLPAAASVLASGDGGGSVSITYGEQHNRSETHITGNELAPSHIQAEGNVNILATGAGERSNILVLGSDIAGKGGTHLEADNAIHLWAAERGSVEDSNSKSYGFNVGVALSAGNGISLGITFGGNYGYGRADGEESNWRNTHIGDAGSATSLVSGGTTSLIGAQVLGQSVFVDAGNLYIESLQDTSSFESKQENISVQVTVGWGFSASVSYSQSRIDADYASVTEQSGIFAGDGGYQINVGGHTDLIGGLITSTQAAEEANRNSFTTASLAYSDIANYAEYDGWSFGISLSFSMGGKGDSSDSGMWTQFGGKDGKAQGSASIGFGFDSDSDKSVTRSGINTQNITITDAQAQERRTGRTVEQTLAAVRTDVTTDNAAERSGALRNNFDRDKVQSELDLQVRVTQEFDKTRQAAKAEINGRIDGLKEARDEGWITQAEYDERVKNWQTLGLVLDSVAAGLYAPTSSLGGSLAAAVSPFAAKEIGDYFKEQEKLNNGLSSGQQVAHVLAHGILAAAVAAAGGNDPLTAGLAAGGAEAAAPLLASWLYGKDSTELNAEQKGTISAIAKLLGAGVGATTGNVANTVTGGMLAQNAVENNRYIHPVQLETLFELVRNGALGRGKKPEDALHELTAVLCVLQNCDINGLKGVNANFQEYYQAGVVILKENPELFQELAQSIQSAGLLSGQFDYQLSGGDFSLDAFGLWLQNNVYTPFDKATTLPDDWLEWLTGAAKGLGNMNPDLQVPAPLDNIDQERGAIFAQATALLAGSAITWKVAAQEMKAGANAATGGEVAAGSQSGSIFRGDTRNPSVIFEEGFKPWGNDTNLLKHAEGNPNSNFVATSTSPNAARSPQFVGNGDYVYTIRGQANGLDVNGVLGTASPYPYEFEIAVPSGISSSDIMGARQIGSSNKFVGPFIKNPNFKW